MSNQPNSIAFNSFDYFNRMDGTILNLKDLINSGVILYTTYKVLSIGMVQLPFGCVRNV